MEGSAVLQRPTAAPRSRRAGSRPRFVQRYWAFISYSHHDKAHADWLHEALEQFRLPKGMIGRGTRYGLVPARLSPVFRDEEDLAAGDDLRDDIQAAIAASRFMVVLCSPAAVASRWVNQEIELFQRLRPDGEIFGAIVGGEPWAADIPGREADECFPSALKQAYDEDGEPTGERAEPVAADFRSERDGRQLGLQKIVAGMLDVGLDELVQRDAQRRHRRMVALTAGSVTGMLVATGLAVTALQARDEARDQRREAEGLVGFMLGDLRDKLEPIGRLDALDAVGARALAYYAKQDRNELGDDGLAQRAKALTLIGDLAQRRGDLDGALRRYRQASDSTSELLRRHPDEPQRMYDHAQNLFFVGSVAWQRGHDEESLQNFREYKRLAERMIALEPGKKEWRLEAIYADTNLGMVLLARQEFGQAIHLFSGTLAATERLVGSEPRDADYQDQMLETLAYLADANQAGGRLDDTLALRERRLALLERYKSGRSDDMTLSRKEMRSHQALSASYLMSGNLIEANRHAANAVRIAEDLMATEAQNTEWADRASQTYLTAAAVRFAAGQVADADRLARRGCGLADQLIARDPTVIAWSETLRRRCLLQRAAIDLSEGRTDSAANLAAQAAVNAQAAEQDRPSRRKDLAEARLLIGEALQRGGRSVEARTQWQLAIRQWPTQAVRAPDDLALRAQLLMRTGDRAGAQEIAARLMRVGYRHPIFIESLRKGG